MSNETPDNRTQDTEMLDALNDQEFLQKIDQAVEKANENEKGENEMEQENQNDDNDEDLPASQEYSNSISTLKNVAIQQAKTKDARGLLKELKHDTQLSIFGLVGCRAMGVSANIDLKIYYKKFFKTEFQSRRNLTRINLKNFIPENQEHSSQVSQTSSDGE